MKGKLSKLLAMLLVAILLLSACAGEKPKDPAGQEAGNGGAKQEITVIKNTDLLSMDSSVATDGTSFEVLGAVQEGLYVLGENGVEVEAMVDKAEVSEDGLTYTFTLKDAKWSNGDPITAGDFVFAWRRLVDPDTESEYAYIADTAGLLNAAEISAGQKKPEELGVKALDDKTLEVKLYKAVPFFKKVLAFGSFLPLNEKFVTEKGADYAMTPENMVYSGPFKMTEWIAGNRFKAVKNENYHDADAVKLDAITWKVAKDYQTAALEFDTGAADFVRISGELIDKYKGDPRLEQALGGYLWYLVSGPSVKELDNENLKLAIANSIDRDELANAVLKDGARGAVGFVPKGLAGSPSGVDFRDDAGEDFFKEGPEKAKEYGKKAFEELGIDKLELELLFEDAEESKKVAEYLQNDIQEDIEGLTITLKSQPKKSRLQLQQDGDFQLSLHRWGPDYPDPMTYLDLYLENSSSNHDKYFNQKYEDMVKLAASGTQSPEDRWKTMIDAEVELLKGALGPVPVYQVGSTTLWNPKVKGWVYNLTGVSYYYKEAYVEE
ncbi:MAG: peptide ABC transporter substrate-binding protein [Tissierellia bacterium]|nr:peptide ABC transporter substrate-binding protein [Tissierellia bacterium]